MKQQVSLFLIAVLGWAMLMDPVRARATSAALTPTATPIKHLVVIFQENVSFDHYFGTYPNALNPPGEPQFTAAPGTPAVNGLTPDLLTMNPNAMNVVNGNGAVNPFRLGRAQAATKDQGHGYNAEQTAFDNGRMDLFTSATGVAGPQPTAPPQALTKGLVMAYYDGNTVTALWNYAQHFAMSDNSYGTVFGPSTPGALNLVSGQSNGVIATTNGTSGTVSDGNGGLSVTGDPDPLGDVCSTATGTTIRMGRRNIGDLLSAAGITWGFFEGGFDLTATNPNGTSGCARSTTSQYTGKATDYVPHHQPFQYYASTANLNHARPASLLLIGQNGDGANHQYDIKDFYTSVQTGNFPAVSFLKAPAYQDGHPGNSNPLDEQVFITQVINFLQTRPEWSSTAVVVAYDDSDGWYDHQLSPTVNGSNTTQDSLNGANTCGNGNTALAGTLNNMFTFTAPGAGKLFLDSTTGQPITTAR